MDERNGRLLATGVTLFRNLVGICAGLYIILSERVLGRMAQTEDETLLFFAASRVEGAVVMPAALSRRRVWPWICRGSGFGGRNSPRRTDRVRRICGNNGRPSRDRV